MRLLPNRSACLLIPATVYLLAASTSPAGASVRWTTPLTLGPAAPAVQKSTFPRVGLTSNGRATVAWNDGAGTILSRDLTLGGTPGTGLSVTRGSLVGAVARDQAGNAVVSGLTSGSPSTAWVATRPKDSSTWTFRALTSATSVNAPAAFGLKSGFLVASTRSFLPTTAEVLPTAGAFGFTTAAGAAIPVGKSLKGVETGDFAHGADGSNWALGTDGHIATTGRRETALPKNGKAPASVAALLRLGKNPTRFSLLGTKRYGAGSVDAGGSSLAVAGLNVQQTNAIAERGIPVVAVGKNGKVGELVEIDDVPDRRALEVDVAARAGGGAYVTWLQQTSSRAQNLTGRPHWALIDSSGEVEDSGTLSTTTGAHALRVVRTGTSALAVWISGEGTSARWRAARITDAGSSSIAPPAGTPVGRITGGLNTSQLQSNGRIVALTFVDAATSSVRVAIQKIG